MSAHSLRKFVPIFGVMALVVLATASSAGVAGAGNGGCKKVEGRVSFEFVFDPEKCSSGCSAGTIKGDIRGSFFVVPTSLDPSLGYVVFTTGDTVFTTSSGTLLSKDASLLSTASGDYAEVITIAGGTGSYEGATGTLTATGRATATGGGGSYAGNICLP